MICKHATYCMKEGQLVCAQCGEPSSSKKWLGNVYGQKAVEQKEVENKGLTWPPQSKRLPGRPGR